MKPHKDVYKLHTEQPMLIWESLYTICTEIVWLFYTSIWNKPEVTLLLTHHLMEIMLLWLRSNQVRDRNSEIPPTRQLERLKRSIQFVRRIKICISSLTLSIILRVFFTTHSLLVDMQELLFSSSFSCLPEVVVSISWSLFPSPLCGGNDSRVANVSSRAS